MPFFSGTKEQYIKQMNESLYSKKYNSGLVDLIPTTTARCLNINIIVVTEFAKTINDYPCFEPQGTPADMQSIVLHLLNMHYSSTTFFLRPLQKCSPPDYSNYSICCQQD